MNDTEQEQYTMLECYEVPYHAYVMNPNMDTSLRQSIKDIMFIAHKNPQNKKYFSNPLNLERWHPQSDDAYNSLRRYLRIVREKPSLLLSWEIRPAAKKMLDERENLYDLIKEGSLNRLVSTQRFKAVSETSGQMENAREVKSEPWRS